MCYVVNMFPPFLKKEKKENQLSFYRLLQWPQMLELWVWIIIYLEWIPFILAPLRFISPLLFTWAGLQAVQGIHHCSGSNEALMPRLLEDDLWERVWGGCDAVRPGGEWKGRIQLQMIFPMQSGRKYYNSKLKGSGQPLPLLGQAVSHCFIGDYISTLPLGDVKFETSSLQEVCHQYWPTGDTRRGQKYGEFNVSVLQATQQDGFIQRVFSVTNPKVRDKQVCSWVEYALLTS